MEFNNASEPLLNALLEPHWSESKIQNVIKIIEQNKHNIHFLNGKSKVKKWTPLMIASREGLFPIVQLLIQHGCDVNQKDINGNTALMLTAGEGHTEIAKLLITAGANVHLENNIGNTALIFAAWDHHGDIVELLLNNGADKHKQNKDGKTAFILAENIVSTGKTIDLLIA